MKFLTKKELYYFVDNLIEQLDLNYDSYPLNSIEIAKRFCVDLKLHEIDFEGICGILYRGNSTYIALNNSHSNLMQNFDCMHELIHYFLHEDINEFNCFTQENSIKQHDGLEWQANEGAAQALVPYQTFIPTYVQLCKEYRNDKFQFKIIAELSKKYMVSENVIQIRLNSLKYEIYQYFSLKKSIEEITLMSHKKLKEANLDALTSNKLYCMNCLSLVTENNIYCKVCGNKLKEFTKMKGLGFMLYNQVSTDEEKRVVECLICKNTDLGDSKYCKICGNPVINRCTDVEYDPFGEVLDGCGALLDSNARYCTKCGSPSLFQKHNMLKDWRIEQREIEESEESNSESFPPEYFDDDLF